MLVSGLPTSFSEVERLGTTSSKMEQASLGSESPCLSSSGEGPGILASVVPHVQVDSPYPQAPVSAPVWFTELLWTQ